MSDSYQAILRGIRMSPRKARLVVDTVRGKSASKALDTLRVMPKKAARLLIKLIDSAVANASSNPNATVDVDNLYISEVFVDGGATWKRYTPRAQGRATPIRKRTSSITLRLTERF